MKTLTQQVLPAARCAGSAGCDIVSTISGMVIEKRLQQLGLYCMVAKKTLSIQTADCSYMMKLMKQECEPPWLARIMHNDQGAILDLLWFSERMLHARTAAICVAERWVCWKSSTPIASISSCISNQLNMQLVQSETCC